MEGKENFINSENSNGFATILEKIEKYELEQDDYQCIEDYIKDRKSFEAHEASVKKHALQEGMQVAKIEMARNYKKGSKNTLLSDGQIVKIDAQQCEYLCNITYEKYRKQIEISLTPAELELGFQYGLEQSFEETFGIEFEREVQKIFMKIGRGYKKLKVDLNTISKATGLSIEEIEQL